MLCYVSILKYKEITFYTTANSELFHMHLIHILHVWAQWPLHRTCSRSNLLNFAAVWLKLLERESRVNVHRSMSYMNEWKCSDLKCIRKPTRSRLILTHRPIQPLSRVKSLDGPRVRVISPVYEPSQQVTHSTHWLMNTCWVWCDGGGDRPMSSKFPPWPGYFQPSENCG